MDEIREKGLCFNSYNRYSKGHTYSENKVFYIYDQEEEDQILVPSQNIELIETTPTIYFHALVIISTPKTIKIKGYIKIK
jgi:hypothetical protein